MEPCSRCFMLGRTTKKDGGRSGAGQETGRGQARQVKWLQVDAAEAATTCCVLLAMHKEEKRGAERSKKGETEGARDIFTPRGGVVDKDVFLLFSKRKEWTGDRGATRHDKRHEPLQVRLVRSS